MVEIDIEKIRAGKKKKKATTLYLDPEVIDVVRDHLGRGESISSLINNILEHLAKVMQEKDKEIQEKKESEVKKESETE